MVAEFTTYCAICSCPFREGDVGSEQPRPLRIRHARIARRKYWDEHKCDWDETDDEEEGGRAERKRYMASVLPPGDELLEDTDYADSIRSSEYDRSYDPTVISAVDMQWLFSTFALGIDHRRPGARRYFITTFEYDDRNRFFMFNAERDPELPEHESVFYSYGVSDLDDPHIFPFHWDCFELLTRVIFGVVDTDLIQKDILYQVMDKLTNFCNLGLDYGDFNGHDQDWQCIPGEEWCLVDPSEGLNLEFFIPPSLTEAPKSTLPDLSPKVVSDPFKTLPYDIIHNILDHLPIDPLLAIRKASWAVCAHTQHARFWKRRIYEYMPWFWELHEYIEKHESRELDYRRLYIWLERETTPSYGMTGPFMGVANRRRIWGPCVELKERYERLIQEKATEATG